MVETDNEDVKRSDDEELLNMRYIKEEEERINTGIKNIRNSHDEMLLSLQYNIKRIDSYLSNSNLSNEDKAFFENQMDIYKSMQKDEEDKFEEIEGELRRQKKELDDKTEQEKETDYKE